MPTEKCLFIVLAANKKVTELEKKLQPMEEKEREQIGGKLLFTIILYSISI